jgi:hypothetical protein
MRIAGGVAAALLLTGCLSSIIPDYPASGQTQSNTGPGGDPGVGSGGSDDAGAAADDGSVNPTTDSGASPDLTDCVPQSASAIDGHHNAGQDCLTCHNGATAGAPKFYLGGTLYSAATGGTAVSQANIVITDANNQTINLVTASLNAPGNFYYDQPVAFPIQVKASSCPTTVPMVSAVQSTGGGCTSCHNAQMQIHLP